MIKKINLDKLLAIFGVLIFAISIITFWGTFKKKSAVENQIKVIAKVIEAPEDCKEVTSRGGYCKLEYNGIIHVKKAGNKFCYMVSNKKTVEVYTNKEKDEIFFIGSYESSDFFFSFAILALAILAITKGLKTKQKIKDE